MPKKKKCVKLFKKAAEVKLRGAATTRTFVQPVGESVEDDALHPRGGDSQRVAPHVGLVVDVILKYVDLRERRGEGIYCTL